MSRRLDCVYAIVMQYCTAIKVAPSSSLNRLLDLPLSCVGSVGLFSALVFSNPRLQNKAVPPPEI